MRIAIVGGCFTNQHNIPFDRLYHQTLKKKLEINVSQVEIRTIRYERISKCLEKIVDLNFDYPFDCLLFHLRAEPMMRLSKLYYRYSNDEGKIKHSLNFPGLNHFKSEKYDLLTLRPVSFQTDSNKRESNFYHTLREMNYIAGSLIGNKAHAFQLLESLILEIHDFCIGKNIQLLLLGPVSRPFSNFEDKLSEEMNYKFQLLAKQQSINYLNLIKDFTKHNASMFFENGIHVSQDGHDEIGNLIYEKLMNQSKIQLNL